MYFHVLTPDARFLLQTMTWGATLLEIARVTSLAPTKFVFVDPTGDLYRWSPAHPGGAYPIHREISRLLGLDHTRFPTPFITVDRYAIFRDPALPLGDHDAWTILPVTPNEDVMAEQISLMLPPQG